MEQDLKSLVVIMLVLLLCAGCSVQNDEATNPLESTGNTGHNESVEADPAVEPLYEIIQTELDYLLHDDIPTGCAEEIIEKGGILRETAYFDYSADGMWWPLGGDEAQNQLVLNCDTFNIENFFSGGGKEILLENVMADRGRKVQHAARYRDYVVWSECHSSQSVVGKSADMGRI